MSTNPFDELVERLERIEKKLPGENQNIVLKDEIIDRVELRKRLNISEPTAILYTKKKKIPSFKIGSAIRYNWPKVLKALEK